MNAQESADPNDAEVNELTEALVGAMPEMLAHLARLLGTKTPKLKEKDAAEIREGVSRCLRRLAPHARRLENLKQKQTVSPTELLDTIEALLRSQLTLHGIRVPKSQSAFDVLVRMKERLAKPKKALLGYPPFADVYSALVSWLTDLCRPEKYEIIDALLSEWLQSEEVQKRAAFARQVPHVLARARDAFAARVTERFVTQLTEEYRSSATFVEQRLRLLCALAKASENDLKPWSHWKKQNLNNLIQMVNPRPPLKPFADLIDRVVRNAVMHGTPVSDYDGEKCTFHDSEKTVTWTLEEFYDKTKRLTGGALALLYFDDLLQLTQAKAMVTFLRTAARAAEGASA